MPRWSTSIREEIPQEDRDFANAELSTAMKHTLRGVRRETQSWMTCGVCGEKWQRRAAENSTRRLRRVEMIQETDVDDTQCATDQGRGPHLRLARDNGSCPHSTGVQHESLNMSSTWHPQVVKKIAKGSQTHAASCERARCEDVSQDRIQQGTVEPVVNKSHAQFERLQRDGQAQPDLPGGESIR